MDKDSVFWFCALLGSGLFFVQFIFTLFGGDNPDDFDGSGEADFGKFKWLSKQALTGFLMMFGWVGVTCRKEFDLSGSFSAVISLISGFMAIVLTSLIFQGAKKLRSPGTIFKIEETIGKEATIYQSIPKNGTGKVTVSFQNFTHEIDAISQHPEDLASFTQVQIIKKIDDTTVLVIPIK